MRIDRVELINFCQHRELTVEFDPQLNLITGSNGSGKTNLLRAMQLALAGEAGGYGTRDDDVSQFRGPREATSVSVYASHAGRQLRFTRELSPARVRVTVDGEQVARTVKEQQEFLETQLGITRKQICDYMFVSQRQIDALFERRPAERTREMHELFGLERLEHIWECLGQRITEINIPEEVAVDEMHQHMQTAASEFQELQQQIEQYADVADGIEERVAQHQAVQDAWSQRRAAEVQRAEVSRQHAAAIAEQQSCQQRLEQARSDQALIEDAVQSVAAEVSAAQQTLLQWQAFDSSLQAREAYQKALSVFAASWRSRYRRPSKPDTLFSPERYAELSEEREGAAVDLGTLDQQLRAVKKLKPGEPCPTCQQPAASWAAGIAALSSQRDAARERHYAIDAEVAPTERYNASMQRYRDDRDQLRTTLLSLRQQRDVLKTVDRPEMSRADAEVTLNDYKALIADASSAAHRVTQTLAEADACQRRITDAEAQLQALQQNVPEAPEEDAATAAAAIKELSRRYREYLDIRARLSAAADNLRRAEQQLEQGVTRNAERDRVVGARDFLVSLRNVFHHSALPRVLSYTYMESIVGSVNETLRLFNAPFSVVLHDGLGFNATFTDGRTVPDVRLSVGERVVLSLALRIALNSTFAQQLNILAMDEPTAGLDTHNLGCLPAAISRMRQLCAAQGTQIFFVTHEPRITYLFDHVIDLSHAP